jgi:hypothetical protein
LKQKFDNLKEEKRAFKQAVKIALIDAMIKRFEHCNRRVKIADSYIKCGLEFKTIRNDLLEVQTLNQKALQTLVPWTDTDEQFYTDYKNTYEKFDEIDIDEFSVKATNETNGVKSEKQ